MALIESMGNAVSGMLSQQTNINVISNNIANVATTGFKSQTVLFKDVFNKTIFPATPPTADRGGTNPKQSGLGVTIAQIVNNMHQGAVQQDGINSHVLIQGSGFFILDEATCPTAYTRDGSFSLDKNKLLVNSDGLQVQGWTADNTGTINNSQPIGALRIPIGERAEARATTVVSYQGNLDASQGVAAPPYRTSVQVFDSLGTPHTMELTLSKTATNTWGWAASFPPGDTATTTSTGTLTYNANGQPLTGITAPVTMTLTDGSTTPQTFTLNFSGTSQLDAADLGTPAFLGSNNTLQARSQDGSAAGELENFSIGQDGVITGFYTNGNIKAVGQLAVATFANSPGLIRTSGNNFQESPNSGQAIIGKSGCLGAGTILSGALEQSNVDVTQEFTKMIVAQRAFQANSRVIGVSDDLLNESLQILRR